MDQQATENLRYYTAWGTTPTPEEDPAVTKDVSQRGGFTAICAQWQKKNATQQWGPMGAKWGLKDLTYEYIRNAAGEIVEVAAFATFYYPEGSMPIGVDMAYRPGNDSRKKLRTSCVSKSLAELGFNSDIFMGLWDDNQYVSPGKAKPAGGNAATQSTPNKANPF